MASAKTFHFDGYTVRPLTERDRALLTELIEGDPYHRERMTADFFMKLMPGEEACALEDETGHVVFYFKTTTCIRIAIQFQPTRTNLERHRNRRALTRGLQWLQGILREHFFHELITDTEAPELRAYVKKRLGFTEGPLLVRTLHSPIEAPRKPPAAVESLSNVWQERLG